jgi:hypothetical protein
VQHFVQARLAPAHCLSHLALSADKDTATQIS